MHALILDMISPERKTGPEAAFAQLETRVLNKPILVHHIENLKARGIESITVLTQKDLSSSLKDGKRWGVDLRIEKALDRQMVMDINTESWIILPGNYLLDWQQGETQSAQENARDGLGWTVLSDVPECFYPMELDLSGALESSEQNLVMNPQKLLNFIERQDTHVVNRYEQSKVFKFNDYESLWKSSQSLFVSEGANHNMAGYPMGNGIWIDVGTRIHESCRAKGYVLVGENSRVHRNVKFKGLVVIGDNVVIDEGSTLEDTIVMDNTYIGRDVLLRQAVTDQKILYRADLNAATLIEDRFLLSSTQ